MASTSSLRFVDIAVNLTDPMYQGTYHGSSKHPSDLETVLLRAKERGVQKILITGTSLQETKDALALAVRYDLQCTAGVHPSSTGELENHEGGDVQYLEELIEVIEKDQSEGGSRKIIAIGEIGLDYDRLNYSPADTQLRYLTRLLALSTRFDLPMFLHSRHPDAHRDMVFHLKELGWGAEKGVAFGKGAVIHSFTGTTEEMNEWIDFGMYIGINGCSLKTTDNLEMVKNVPLDRLLLETDGPWCTPVASHASHPLLPDPDHPLALLKKVKKPQAYKEGQGVKGRMEPAEITAIAHIVATVKGISVEELAEAAWNNTMRLFYPNEVGM